MTPNKIEPYITQDSTATLPSGMLTDVLRRISGPLLAHCLCVSPMFENSTTVILSLQRKITIAVRDLNGT